MQSNLPLFTNYHRHDSAGMNCSARPASRNSGRLLELAQANCRRARISASARCHADLVFVSQGITFSVYSDRRGVEIDFPVRPHPTADGRRGVDYDGRPALVQRIRAAEPVPP